jgi:hypothetical protein
MRKHPRAPPATPAPRSPLGGVGLRPRAQQNYGNDRTNPSKPSQARRTGPRTKEGKAKSSQNALKHGLGAQITVLPDENIGSIACVTSCRGASG